MYISQSAQEEVKGQALDRPTRGIKLEEYGCTRTVQTVSKLKNPPSVGGILDMGFPRQLLRLLINVFKLPSGAGGVELRAGQL